MTSINNYQCHYTLIKKMMTSKPEDRLRKKGVKTRKYYKWLRWSMKKSKMKYLLRIYIIEEHFLDCFMTP